MINPLRLEIPAEITTDRLLLRVPRLGDGPLFQPCQAEKALGCRHVYSSGKPTRLSSFLSLHHFTGCCSPTCLHQPSIVFTCFECDPPPALDRTTRCRSNLLSLNVTLASPSNRLHRIFEPGRPAAIPRDLFGRSASGSIGPQAARDGVVTEGDRTGPASWIGHSKLLVHRVPSVDIAIPSDTITRGFRSSPTPPIPISSPSPFMMVFLRGRVRGQAENERCFHKLRRRAAST